MKVSVNKEYSITMDNGITISAESVEVLSDYLYDLHSAFFELRQYYFNVNMQHDNKFVTLEKHTDYQRRLISMAIDKLKLDK